MDSSEHIVDRDNLQNEQFHNPYITLNAKTEGYPLSTNRHRLKMRQVNQLFSHVLKLVPDPRYHNKPWLADLVLAPGALCTPALDYLAP